MIAADERVAAVLAHSPWAGRAGLRWRPGVPAVASPMWQAVEWDQWIVSCDDGPDLLLRLLHPDMAGLVDMAAAQAGALSAMRADVAPAVAFALPRHDALGLMAPPPDWRGAKLDDLGRPDVMRAAIAAKQAVRRNAAFARDWDVFALARDHAARARAAGAGLPADLPDLLARVAEIGAAVEAAGRDRAPCHNDGQASNLLLGPDGRVLLGGFDCAGQADPYYDLAVLLNEAYAFEADWRAAIEMHDGACADRVLHRCRAYAVADDLLWGLRGLLLSAVSPRRDLEFLKYGEWRLLRCRLALREPNFADRLHRL